MSAIAAIGDADAMGYPRCHLIDPTAVGVYHCVSRCVRRAFLCGEDALSGRNFDHRKQWLEDRLLTLAETFSVSLLAYAVMSNHLHVVLRVDPDAAAAWSNEEVAERWVRLFPVTHSGEIDDEGCRRKAAALAGNDERIAELRARLSSLSWLMRCVSEPLARLANREDQCSGRFWEGRFKCQSLLDDAAVLACMTYVDLNPVRAGAATQLTNSHHTSIQRRIHRRTDSEGDAALTAVAGSPAAQLSITLDEYIDLVDWTGRQLHPGKHGAIAEDAPRVLRRFGTEAQWAFQVRGIESRYWRAIGCAQSLLDKAIAIGQRWMKGPRAVAIALR